MKTFRRRATAVIAAACVAGALAACDPGDPAPSPTSASPTAARTVPIPDPPASSDPVEVAATINGVDIDFSVGPVGITEDGVGILRIEAEATGGNPAGVSLGSAMSDPGARGNSLDGIVLVDLEEGRVSTALRESDGTPAATLGNASVRPDGAPIVLWVAYPVPTTSTVDALVPLVGLVPDVPVLAADTAGVEMAELIDLTPAPLADLYTRTSTLETYREEGDGNVHTRGGEETTVGVDSDVLFATGSAELSPDADASLTVAGGQIAPAAGGTLTVVGHTDDVGDATQNQTLSEQRAQAVADRLGLLVDLSAYDVVVEGRGAGEPVADNGTDEGRALNRRVELVFAGARAAAEPGPGAPQFPASQGPTAAGAEPVQVTQVDYAGREIPFTVSVADVRRVDGYLVGRVTITNASEVDAVTPSFLGTPGEGRASGSYAGVANLTLLTGTSRVFPIDFEDAWSVGSTYTYRRALADSRMPMLDAGQSVTATVVWPDVDADTVTIDAPSSDAEGTFTESAVLPFRLTDVPVTA